MKGIRDFIIEVDGAFKDTIHAGTVELYIDKKISRDRSSNRLGKIINTPCINDDETLTIGDQIIFDATVLYRQIYKEGEQDSAFLVDREKQWYKIDPAMIILFRKSDEDQWKGYGNNLMVELKTTNASKETQSGIIISIKKETLEQGKAIIKYINHDVETYGAQVNDEVYIQNKAGVPFFIDGHTYHWVRTKDLLAL